MNRIERIESTLNELLKPAHLNILDESRGHASGGTHTHLRVVVVSVEFIGKSRIARHRTINAALSNELQTGLHALAVEALTPEQWASQSGATALKSPPCASGRPQPD
jgi:BolA protein